MNKRNRRTFLKESIAFSMGLGSVVGLGRTDVSRADAAPAEPADFPMGKIGEHTISRLIIGGHPFSFISHSEPLIYCSRLLQAYFTHEKTVETLQLCVKNGINTFLSRIDDNVSGFLNLYEKTTGSRMPWIAQTSEKPHLGASRDQIDDNIRWAGDSGAIGCYIQGDSADYLVAENNLKDLEHYLELIRKLGMIAGIGAHLNETVEASEKEMLEPDFYMKTINNQGYWADDPDRTAEIMAEVNKPWIAFKVLGAGRIHPRDGFHFAMEAGADYLCVGMFDFQVEENVRLAREAIQEVTSG